MSATPEFEIGPETETPTHWAYEVTVFGDGQARRLTVTLSFQDYDHWCRGRVPPVRLVDATLRLALAKLKVSELGETLDCSTVRRRVEGFDAALSAML